MTVFDVDSIRAKLPLPLSGLAELAIDLRWTWSHAGDVLWRTLDERAWRTTRNPRFILENVAEERLAELARNATFCAELDRVLAERTSYRGATPAVSLTGTVAYFCMEFGLGSAVPLYAGGLGILAGDYLKTASDLALPVVGVGILYQEGYFRQSIDADGRQHETFSYNDPSILPIEPALGSDGAWKRISLELPGRPLWLRIWRARVGRVDLFLLDGNDPENGATDRGITAKLYGGHSETRLLQEMVLGIGGPRALTALGIEPSVMHLNEGHAAFVGLERARSFALASGVPFRRALWATRAGNVFTTHTPVPAGVDVFAPELVAKYFPSSGEYLAKLGVSLEELLGLGRKNPDDAQEPFSMMHLAVRCSSRVNGVSRVHGGTTRRMLAPLFPRWPDVEIPAGHVTNGVHPPSWDSSAADALWTNACGKGRWLGGTESLETTVAKISDEELWSLRATERHELVRYARRRLESQLATRGVPELVEQAHRVLDPNALTLGFARRFAEYKRPNLLLTDPDRFARLLSDPERPVQIVVAGKAHPDDEGGKGMIAEWIAFCARPDVRSKAVFIEDYDMAVAQEMVSGVDVWINTPRRPWEACGTSGMKVLVNGGLNLSELDGWWAEAWSPGVGWGLGDGDGRTDRRDAEDVYSLLEHEIVREFCDRDDTGIPRAWIARIRASISRLTPLFSSNRMVLEYARDWYTPAGATYLRRARDGAAVAAELVAWSERVASHWQQIHFGAVDAMRISDGLRFRVAVYLGEIDPESVAVELYADESGQHPARRAVMRRDGALSGAANGHAYELTLQTDRPSDDFTARVVPRHDDACIPLELPLVVWQR